MDDFQQSFADEENHDGFLAGGVRPDSNTYPAESSPLEDTSLVSRDPLASALKDDSNGGVELETGNERVTGSSVYIANLQWWTTDAEVERLCNAYGTVLNIQFLAERSNGKSKGVALVEFADNQGAVRCKEGLSG